MPPDAHQPNALCRSLNDPFSLPLTMRLTMAFYAVGPWEAGIRTLDLPMEFALEPYGHYSVQKRPAYPGTQSIGKDLQALLVVGERNVDPDGLRLVDDVFMQELPDGNYGPAEAITCPEVDELTEGVLCVGGAISFALGVPLDVSPLSDFRIPNRYIAESPGEEERLEALGRQVRLPISGTTGIEVFDDAKVDTRFVQELAARHAVRIYAEALRVNGLAATFRELWRTLELAFQAHGKELVKLIAEFPPATRLEFDRSELEELLGHVARSGVTGPR